MFVSVYFPIFDSRSFFSGRVSLTRRPRWPSVAQGSEFQRNLGPIRTRPLGGIRGWAAEPEVCEIGRAIQFSEPKDRKVLERISPQFVRFYSDGWGGCQFSFGTPILLQWYGRSIPNRYAYFVDDLMRSSIRSRHRAYQSTVATAAHLVSDLYGTGTSKGNYPNQELEKIFHAPPLVFIQLQELNRFKLTLELDSILSGKIGEGNFAISYESGRTPGAMLSPTFYIYSDRGISRNNTRAARIILARLYLELFCFERCLGMLTGTEFGKMDNEGKELLARRLNLSAARLSGRLKPRIIADRKLYERFVDIFSTLHRPGKIDELLNGLIRLSASANFQDRVLSAITGQFDFGREPKLFDLMTRTKGRIIVAGKYVNLGQVGAMGDQAQARQFEQVWQGTQSNIDLRELAVQLNTLQNEMQQSAKEDADYQSIAAVIEAKNAAGAGEGPSAMAALAKAGKWALGVAEKIGIGVAAGAIKTALGI